MDKNQDQNEEGKLMNIKTERDLWANEDDEIKDASVLKNAACFSADLMPLGESADNNSNGEGNNGEVEFYAMSENMESQMT